MILHFAADENFNQHILDGIGAALPSIDVVRVIDVGLGSAPDPSVLEWAAREQRVLLTHDAATMPAYAYERMKNGRPVPGVVLVASSLEIGRAIEELLLLIECSYDDEWESQVRYIP